MIVTARKYDATKEEWEYQLKNGDGIEYGNGSWVTEDDLKDATGGT